MGKWITKYIAMLLAISLVCSLFIMPVFAVEDTTKTEILIEKTFANNKFSFKKIDIQDAKVVSMKVKIVQKLINHTI